MPLLMASRVVEAPRDKKMASREETRKVDRLAQEIEISWKDLNKVAREVLGVPELKDVRFLSSSKSRKLYLYLKMNYAELQGKYHKSKGWS